MFRAAIAILGLPLAAVVLSGCPSFATLKTARALEPGELQVTGASEVLGMAAPANKGVGGARPGLIVGARYGVAKGFDVGVRLEPVAGVLGETTVQIVRGPIDVAVGPGLGYFLTPGPVAYAPKTIEQMAISPLYTIASGTFPLLLGYNLKGGHQVVLAPRATVWLAQPQASQPGGAGISGGLEVFAGASAGVSLKTSRTLRLMPEVGVTAPVLWTGRGESCAGAACAPIVSGALIVQGGLAITLGADSLGP